MAQLVVIDDDDAIRGWLAAVLRAARHQVRAFSSAEAALPHLTQAPPDLLLSDIRLPGQSGLELLATLRASHGTMLLPVILITSVAERQVFRRGMELGADDFITKPLTVEEVTRAVDARLARAHAATSLERVNAISGNSNAAPVTIGPFRIEKRLARSVGAEVYLGHSAAGIRAAIKVLSDTAATLDDPVRERFMREIETAATVVHPNLAAVLDRGMSERGPYVVFEYFPMGDLASSLSRGISPNLACRIVVQVAAGLEALHQAGIVHRDVKPANIMIRSASSFAVTDFGAAKRMRIDTSLTMDGRIIGTPSYVSPEQITRKPLGPQTDIYSLGVVLYELLAGSKPFAGDDFHQVLYSHVAVAPPPLPARLAKFQPVLDRMLAKDPAARYSSCAELAAAVNTLAF